MTSRARQSTFSRSKRHVIDALYPDDHNYTVQGQSTMRKSTQDASRLESYEQRSTEERTTTTIPHTRLIDNIIVFEEFIKELMAIIQVRALHSFS